MRGQLDQLGPLASPELDRADTHWTLHLGGAVLDQPEHLAAFHGAQGAHHGGADFLGHWHNPTARDFAKSGLANRL